MVFGIDNPLNNPTTSESEYEILEEAHIWGEVYSRHDSGKIDIIRRLINKGLLRNIRTTSHVFGRYSLTPSGKKVIKMLFKEKERLRPKYKRYGDE